MPITKAITIFLFAAIAITAKAAKSTGIAHIFTQSDGTTISVQLLGDEDFSWYQTTDGAILVRIDNNFYIAKTNNDGTLTSTNVLAHNSDARTPDELSLIAAQDASLMKAAGDNILRAKRKVIAGYPSNIYCPHSGTVRVPIILMNYTDTVFTYSDKAVWEEYFNSTTSSISQWKGYGSVAKYFSDASNGKLNFVFDIYGPYTATHGHNYYGSNQGTSKELSLLTEAVSTADNDIDFSQYDSNNDGRVDMVYIVYAGTGANISGDKKDFWPACWSTSGSYTSADGKKINIIGGASELSISVNQYPSYGSKRAGIGVTCHEMSHGMGLPDLYWTSGTPTDASGNADWNNCGPEDWDLMDGGENLYVGIWPCQYTAWERDVMGWITTDELTEPCTVKLYPLNKDGGKACRVTNPNNKNEYYIIENYQYDGWNYYIKGQYGSGLMITHVNSSSSGLSMTPNNTYGKPNVTILPADGTIVGSYSVVYGKATQSEYYTSAQGDPYVGTMSSNPVTSVAAYKNYTGEDMVNTYPITDITRNSDGSITFKFMGGATGDANDDGEVNITDLSTTINHLQAPDTYDINTKAADINGDDKITVDDLDAIKDIILNK